MITNHVIQNSVDDLYAITKVNLVVYDSMGQKIASAGNIAIDDKVIIGFTNSPADSQVISGSHLMKVFEGTELAYIVVSNGASESAYNVARIAVSQLGQLMIAYQEKYDKNSFYQNLLLDNMLLVDIYNRAKKLHISTDGWRNVYLIDTKRELQGMATELIKGMYSSQSGDVVTAIDEDKIILLKSFEECPSSEDLKDIADTIVSLINTEAMANATVAYGNPVNELKNVSKSYKEGKLALDVSRIFYEEKSVAAYSALGIGRLIYQLPINLCEMYIEEVFGDGLPKELDEDTIYMLNKFFENNLNVSQTSDQIYMHRNTIIYKIEKVQKATGLNLREFEDALTYKIAMMVQRYLDYIRSTN